MKCISCRNKFPTKNTQRCKHLSSRICLKCSIEGQGQHSCDLSCENARFPRLKTFPLSDSVIGDSPTGEIRGTTEEFIPRSFHFISCTVNQIRITLKNLNLLTVELEYNLQGNESLTKNTYWDEGWKLIHLERLLKDRKMKVDFSMAPTFTCFTHAALRIIPETVKLSVNRRQSLVLINDTAEMVGLPNSFPPLTERQKSIDEKYSYFIAKSSVFYTPFILNGTYHMTFDVEATAIYYELGFLFPYRFTSIKSFNVLNELDFELGSTRIREMFPFQVDSYPPKQTYEWERHNNIGKAMRPWITRADPFRNQPMVGADVGNEKATLSNNNIKTYSAIQALILLKKPKDRELIVSVKTTESPLPIRVYEQLQKLPRYRDFLLNFDLFNLTDKQIELELTGEIKGYTDKAIENVSIPAYGSESSYHIVKSLIPKLKRGILPKVSLATEATLYYEIYKKDKGKRTLIERNTRTIKLLSHDSIIWVIKDPNSPYIYDLSKMLGAWITASDPKGLLDKVRADAASYHPSNFLTGAQKGVDKKDIDLQIKALYDCLSNKYKMRYVNQPFSFDFNAGSQRVLLPERCISIKAGNCIDLVVLFASLMEGLGINPLIMLMEDHAFLGWGNSSKTSEMGFLECTTLGIKNKNTGNLLTFEESSAHATKTFKDNFLFIGSDDYLPIHSITYSSGKGKNFIVDLEEVRREGIARLV